MKLPELLAQDESRELSKALSADPAAPLQGKPPRGPRCGTVARARCAGHGRRL
jgi:hypothetical protein